MFQCDDNTRTAAYEGVYFKTNFPAGLLVGTLWLSCHPIYSELCWRGGGAAERTLSREKIMSRAAKGRWRNIKSKLLCCVDLLPVLCDYPRAHVYIHVYRMVA